MVAEGEANPDVMDTNTKNPLQDDSDSDGDDSQKKSLLLRRIQEQANQIVDKDMALEAMSKRLEALEKKAGKKKAEESEADDEEDKKGEEDTENEGSDDDDDAPPRPR